jgi:hypothetical protein
MLRMTILTVWLLLVMLMVAAGVLASPARPAQAAESCDWTGVWLPFEGEWRLVQNGTRVSGSYLDGKGIIDGAVDGNVLRGQWKEAPTYSPPFDSGRFTVTMTADCDGFVGTLGFGDAECCNVLSAIRFDTPSPALAVQVENGSLVVDGQTIPPGATYFPPNCPPAGRSPADECATFLVGGETHLKFSCFLNRLVRVLLVMENAELGDLDEEMLMDIIVAHVRERCGLPVVRQGDWALELAIRQGAANITGVTEGLTIGVVAGPATSTLNGPGSFVVGHDPAAAKATFLTYSSPLDVEPASGAAFTLPPYSRVEVTPGGPGVITSLTRLYLPMGTR